MIYHSVSHMTIHVCFAHSTVHGSPAVGCANCWSWRQARAGLCGSVPGEPVAGRVWRSVGYGGRSGGVPQTLLQVGVWAVTEWHQQNMWPLFYHHNVFFNKRLNVSCYINNSAVDARAGSPIEINYLRPNVSSVYGLDDVECQGNEASLSACQYKSGAQIDCSGSDEYASVACSKLDNAPPSRKSLSLSLSLSLWHFFCSVFYYKTNV